MTQEFGIDDDERLLRDGFRDLLGGLMSEPRRQEVLAGPAFSTDVWRELSAGGWLEVAVTGDGDDPSAGTSALLVALSQEVGAHQLPGPFALVASVVVPLLHAADGADPVGCADVVGGRTLATIVLPSCGSPLAPEWSDFRVVEEAAGRVRLAGRAAGVLVGHLADWILVPVARTDGTVAVAAIPGDAPGLVREPEAGFDFTRPTATIATDGLWVDASSFLGGWEQDHRELLADRLLRYLLCVDGESIGGAATVVERTTAFVTERRQFGVPVGSFQAVKHLMADAYGEMEVARGLAEHVAWRLDHDADPPVDDVIASRVLSADMYPSVVERCIQCHGGAGFTWEQGLHGWYRQALFYRHHPYSPDALRQQLWTGLADRRGAAAPIPAAAVAAADPR